MGKLKEDFIIFSFLFEDEYGKVYRAYNRKEDRKVWIKEIYDFLLKDEKYRKKFLAKVEKVKNLKHKNIQEFYDYWEEDGKFFLELENLTGTFLDDVIYNPRRLDRFEVISIAYQLFTTLSFAHSRGVIHENVRPEHITIEDDGDIKITNFMMVDPLQVHKLRVKANVVVDEGIEFLKFVRFATPWHLNRDVLEWYSDFFSAAVTVFELATKDTPWDRSSPMEFFNSVRKQKPVRSIWDFRKDLSLQFAIIISKCFTDYNWERKYFKDEVFEILQEDYDTVVKPVLMERKRKKITKSRVHKLITFALGTILSVGLLIYPFQRENLGSDTSIPIIVLPVENKTENPSLTPIAVGITQEIIESLSYVNPFSVIPFENQKESNISNKNFILKSEIKGGKGTEFESKLFRTKNGKSELIWSSRFDFKDASSIKFYLSSDIMNVLGLDFKGNGFLPLSKRVSPEVYNLYLNSIYWHNIFMKDPKKEYLEISRNLLLKANDLDRSFSSIYSALASNYFFQIEYGFSGNPQIIELAKEMCFKALEIDKNDLRARLILAFLCMRENKKIESWRKLKEIYSFNPKNSVINGALGTLYQYSGILDKAIEKYEKARKANPLQTITSLNIARIHIFKGEYSKAEKELRKILERSENQYAISYLGLALSYQGKLEEAKKLLENALEKYPEDKVILLSLATVYSKKGRFDKADEILKKIEPSISNDPDRAYRVATCYSLKNDIDSALKWLMVSIKNGNENYPLFKNDPYLENLRKDAKFQGILKEMEGRWKIYKKKFTL